MVDVNKRLDADSSMTVSILCYNLLAQDLIHKNMYLYDSHEPDVLSWDYRKINLFADLGGSKADVRCTLFVCVCVNIFTESPSLSYYFLRYSVCKKFNMTITRHGLSQNLHSMVRKSEGTYTCIYSYIHVQIHTHTHKITPACINAALVPIMMAVPYSIARVI